MRRNFLWKNVSRSAAIAKSGHSRGLDSEQIASSAAFDAHLCNPPEEEESILHRESAPIYSSMMCRFAPFKLRHRLQRLSLITGVSNFTNPWSEDSSTERNQTYHDMISTKILINAGHQNPSRCTPYAGPSLAHLPPRTSRSALAYRK